ncbi:hypothetical protein BDV96DRAFT_599228 [Lophiotrema nucula]|uniref:Uncharacterized protein n=1 Tax=Lophiotrema nucula TaxID=690887 RepID=A0A6A5ZA91_9PLEO|nr:hypothetical protein BDV96DRAFT_599228 [Lophiotrema nucula]
MTDRPNLPENTSEPTTQLKGFDAEWILPPEEFSLYCDFVTEFFPLSVPQGFIRGAHDYHDFTRWKEDTLGRRPRPDSHEDSHDFVSWEIESADPRPGPKVDTPSEYSTSLICNHILHPLQHTRNVYCTVCEVKIHLKFLAVLDHAWDAIGGPWKNGIRDFKKHGKLRAIRHRARLQLANLQEMLYDRSSQELENGLEGVRSATLALECLETGIKYPAKIKDEPLEKTLGTDADPPADESEFKHRGGAKHQKSLFEHKSGRHPRFKSSLQTRTITNRVGFAEETTLGTGRDMQSYARRSLCYVAGKHAPQTPEGHEDVSHMCNPWYAIEQLKLLITTNATVFRNYQKEDVDPPLDGKPTLAQVDDAMRIIFVTGFILLSGKTSL